MRCPMLLAAGLLTAMALPSAATAAPLGDSTACNGDTPAILVRVTGFKEPRGLLRFALYDSAGWLKKGASLKKVKVPVSGRSMDVCIAVPRPGAYGVAVHHDIDSDKAKDRTDGAGFSGNPSLSLVGRPGFTGSRVQVAGTVVPIAVRLQYLRGLSIGPLRNG